MNNGAKSTGSKEGNDTVQSGSCGGLILIWNSVSIAKRPKAEGTLRKSKRDKRGSRFNRRNIKQDKGKLSESVFVPT